MAYESLMVFTGNANPLLAHAVVRRLNTEMVSGLHAADVSRLVGINVIGGTPEEFARFVKEQQDVLAKLLKMAGIQPQ